MQRREVQGRTFESKDFEAKVNPTDAQIEALSTAQIAALTSAQIAAFDASDLAALSTEQIVRLCDRHRGIGADGLLAVEGGPERLSEATLVVIPSLWTQGPAAAASHPRVIDALRSLPASIRVVTLCSGVFLLAATGRLDGHVTTTHWMLADDLQARHPAVAVDATLNLAQFEGTDGADGADWTAPQGGWWCSGGSLAGVDACL